MPFNTTLNKEHTLIVSLASLKIWTKYLCGIVNPVQFFLLNVWHCKLKCLPLTILQHLSLVTLFQSWAICNWWDREWLKLADSQMQCTIVLILSLRARVCVCCSTIFCILNVLYAFGNSSQQIISMHICKVHLCECVFIHRDGKKEKRKKNNEKWNNKKTEQEIRPCVYILML